MNNIVLLTGRPGSGKTTLIRGVLAHLTRPAGGFYTQEIRESGIRKGFEIVTLDEKRGVLAHMDSSSEHRISKYGVELSALETLAIPALQDAIEHNKLVVIDEIGPMEILSPRFRQVVLEILESNSNLLGTIVGRCTPFTDRIKAQPEITLIDVTPENRAGLVNTILEMLEGQTQD